VLELKDVSVSYGRIAAVQGLSLEVKQGEFVGIVGHNGTGKSTTLMTISGALPPVSGDILLEGKSIVGLAPDEILRRGIALVPEGRRIFGRLSVGENIKIGATVRKDGKGVDEDIRKMLERFPVLAIARALVSTPKLLLLDEPTLGLAPLMVDRVFEILEQLHASGTTILLVEQNAARTIEMADRTYVLRTGGRIQFHGTAAELAAIGDFETAYIGMG
jgi:branched-chain amino acid transport system ATP-binding protein